MQKSNEMVQELDELMRLPMPGERFNRGVVVASCWINDLDGCEYFAVLLLLDEAPYYRVREYDREGVIWGLSFDNIVPATAEYQERTGCI